MKLAVTFFVIAATCACTRLGAMPAATGVTAVPMGRPGIEVAIASMPAYTLDRAATTGGGQSSGQLSALFDPDRLLGIPGLVVGLRSWGQVDDYSYEPVLGYRHVVGSAGRAALAVFVYGTHMSGADHLASYSGNRGGAEVAGDAELAQLSEHFAIHGQASIAATAMSAKGQYCVNSAGVGIDCDAALDDQGTLPPKIAGQLSGVYPSATATLAFDWGRRNDHKLHHIRLAALLAAGEEPRMLNGVQGNASAYVSLGLSLTFAWAGH